ncbi:MAG: CdaR family protein [Eubacteriales bacterium]|nr:CdaR family protein [Eubacteriales bacterium]
MKEKIVKNFSLKVLSVVCEIILWAVIVNVNDPNTGYTFSNVTVQLINTESLTNNGYTYEVIDGGKISVYVSGPKSVVTDLKTSDIVATADLSKVSAFADYVDINVQVIKDGSVCTDVEATPKTSAVKLSIDNRVSQNFNINISNTGSVAEGYSIVSQTIAPNTVRITGSSSLIASIDSVKAVVDVSGMSSDISMAVPISIYDIEDNILPLDGMEVDYKAVIQLTKNVPVKYSLSGKVAEGCAITGTHISQDYVTLAGSPDSINNINEVVIPSDKLDVTSLTRDKTFSINISKFVPEGITIVSNKTIQVDVKVESTYTKNFTVDLSNVTFTNSGSTGMHTASVSGNLVVTVKGSKAAVDSISEADIKMTIDLSGLSVGIQTVPISFKLPAGCTMAKEYTAQIEVGADNQEDTSEEQTTTAG